MSLAEKLAALKAEATAQMPPDLLNELHAAMEELLEMGPAKEARKPGDIAPSFTLPDARGEMIDSAGLLARGPLVLTFYRGNW